MMIGSFGTDRCVGAKLADSNMFLTIINYETYWCCSMRGGEGFGRAIEFTYFVDGNKVFVPFYNRSSATINVDSGNVELKQKCDYPYYGKVSFKVVNTTNFHNVELNFFAPSFTKGKDIIVKLNGEVI